MTIKLSEQVRRLEDSIESLRAENKKLREGEHKEPRLRYKGNINSFKDLPSEGNEEGDFYTYKIYDKVLDEGCTGKYVRYKNKWIDLYRVIKQKDERDEIIDHQKRDIEKLKKELGARVKQVEDLQSSYKTLQEENKRLKSKLADKKKLESDKYEFIDDDGMINPKNFLDYLDKHFF